MTHPRVFGLSLPFSNVLRRFGGFTCVFLFTLLWTMTVFKSVIPRATQSGILSSSIVQQHSNRCLLVCLRRPLRRTSTRPGSTTLSWLCIARTSKRACRTPTSRNRRLQCIPAVVSWVLWLLLPYSRSTTPGTTTMYIHVYSQHNGRITLNLLHFVLFTPDSSSSVTVLVYVN